MPPWQTSARSWRACSFPILTLPSRCMKSSHRRGRRSSACVMSIWPGLGFLLLAGNTAAYRNRSATIQVASLAPVLAALDSADGEVVEEPTPAPNGARLIARHPDGAVFEYIETIEAGGELSCLIQSGPRDLAGLT